jgi:hypothetical protein
MMRYNRLLTFLKVSEEMNMIRDAVISMLNRELNMQKFRVITVPKNLSGDKKLRENDRYHLFQRDYWKNPAL